MSQDFLSLCCNTEMEEQRKVNLWLRGCWGCWRSEGLLKWQQWLTRTATPISALHLGGSSSSGLGSLCPFPHQLLVHPEDKRHIPLETMKVEDPRIGESRVGNPRVRGDPGVGEDLREI